MRATWRLRTTGEPAAAVKFPNRSRVYDPTRRAVRFWGYHNAMESSFFVTADALRRLQPSVQLDEASLLRTFDVHRELIHATAVKVHARGRKGSYDLVSADF